VADKTYNAYNKVCHVELTKRTKIHTKNAECNASP